MTVSDSSDQGNPVETQVTPATPTAAATPEAPPLTPAATSQEQREAAEVHTAGSGEGSALSEEAKRRILIGSQRDPAAYRPRRRDWIPIEETGSAEEQPTATAAAEPAQPAEPVPTLPRNQEALAPAPALAREEKAETASPPAEATQAVEPRPAAVQMAPVAVKTAPAAVQTTPVAVKTAPPAAPARDRPARDRRPRGGRGEGPPRSARAPRPDKVSPLASAAAEFEAPVPPRPAAKVPPPSVRDRLSPELEAELNEAMADAPLDELLSYAPVTAEQEQLEAESRHTGRVLALRRDDVFVELGGREQGIVSIRQFETPPEVGTTVEVVVQRLNPEDGLYELSIPNKAVNVENWADISEGMLVEAQVTGSNSGGLECEVNHLRGFIPLSQIALYRVEDATQFVGQRLTCVVTEANPERRNLVLSRRAVLEREREEVRQQLMQSLQPGEVREGVVRKLLDFGAFVDLGGVDGLLHISQLAWHRVKHPSDVLAEGQHIKVKIERIDPDTGKISLAYRDLMESPWLQAAAKFPPNGIVQGKVTKLMEFGAFVELEPGVEGLVHISELSHKRIWRTSDVVKEGDEVEVLVLSVDPQSQRISLSMKALAPATQPAKKEDEGQQPAAEAAAAAAPPAKPKKNKPEAPLSGGLGCPAGGKRFGMKW